MVSKCYFIIWFYFTIFLLLIILDLTLEHKEVLARLKNMERVLYENRYENTELRKERDVYKIQLKSLCEQHKQYQQREAIAHAKIQDAIQMVEAAVAEKNAALQREKEIRGELNSFISFFEHFESNFH